MIIAPQFVIGHIGKTAGDAVKQIVAAMDLPEVNVISVWSPLKHTPFQHWRGDLRGRDFALSIRRLPAFVLSQFQHRRRDARLQQRPTGECMCQDYMADYYIRLYTDEGRLTIAHWLRSESIRIDLAAMLSNYYTLSEKQERLLDIVGTKPQMDYNHDLHKHFTPPQLQAIYDRNPLWAEIERQVYGHLLVDDTGST